MSIRNAMNQINNEIDKLHEEKLQLRRNCKHNSYRIEDFMGTLSKMCRDCDNIDFAITAKEVEEFNNEYIID